MRRVPWTAAGGALLLAALVLPAAQPERKRSEAETRAAELKELNARVESAKHQAQEDAEEAERLAKALRDAERAMTRASGDLRVLGTQRAQRAAARQQLVGERTHREADRDATQADLASQLRAAYFMGHSEPLKLLLNQRSPAEFGRNLTYYGYLGRLRASQIELITNDISKIDELTAKIDEEDAKLADLELKQRQKLTEREVTAKKREEVLTSMREQARGSAGEFRRLQAQRQQLDELVKKLEREAQAAPFDPDKPFNQRNGKLSWPVAGRIVTNFGARQPPDLVSDYVDIDAARGADVRVVHEGKVLYADYQQGGRGNTIIVDHGNGYWSVYAHLEELFKSRHEKVAAGEKIATVGDTGGRKRPGLYFQLLLNTKPVDPRGWFRSPSPPGG